MAVLPFKRADSILQKDDQESNVLWVNSVVVVFSWKLTEDVLSPEKSCACYF